MIEPGASRLVSRYCGVGGGGGVEGDGEGKPTDF